VDTGPKRLARARIGLAAALVVLGSGAHAAAAEGYGPTEVIPTLAVRAAVPTAASASLTLTIGATSDSPQFCAHEPLGPSVSVEAGTGGGQLAFGIGTVCLDTPLLPKYGLALRAVVARTWGNPVRTEPGQTYLGVNLDLTALATLRLGVLKHVGKGDPRARDWLFVYGVGFGF